MQTGLIRHISEDTIKPVRVGFEKHGSWKATEPILLLPLIEGAACAPFRDLYRNEYAKFWRQVVAYANEGVQGADPPPYELDTLDQTLPWAKFRLGIVDGANRHYLCMSSQFNWPQVCLSFYTLQMYSLSFIHCAV